MKKIVLFIVVGILATTSAYAGPRGCGGRGCPPPPPHHRGCGGPSRDMRNAYGIMGLVQEGITAFGRLSNIVYGPRCGVGGPGVVMVPQQPVVVAQPPVPTITYGTPNGGYYVQPVTQPVQMQCYQPGVATAPAPVQYR